MSVGGPFLTELLNSIYMILSQKAPTVRQKLIDYFDLFIY